jgi:hypothetical protein
MPDVNVDGNKVVINTFDPTKMVAHPSIIIIAKRGSGKSVLCKALLQLYKDIPVGIIISPTDRMNCFYGDFFPQVFIHYNYRSSKIQKILQRQLYITKLSKELKLKKKKIDTRCFIIMDDCLADNGTWAKDQPVRELLMNGRHYHIMYILIMQYPLGIKPDLRSQFDYIFLLAEDFISNQKRMHDHYAGMFPDFKSFQQVYRQLTNDFGAMVIVNRGARLHFNDKVFFYKAPVIDDSSLTFGCKQFNDFNKYNYNKNWENRYNIAEPEDIMSKSKKSREPFQIQIKKDY